MFDPTLPQENTEIDAAQMRSQLNGLKALIDAITTLSAAQVDGVATLPPGLPAAVSVTVTGNTLHFTFQIPQGEPGTPGEVSQSQLDAAILGTAINPSSISPIGTMFMDPVSASDLNIVVNKVDELISVLKRNA